MLDDEKKLQLLKRHIEHVQDDCEKLSEYLIENGEIDLARELIKNSMIHDISKFEKFEFDHIFDRNDPLFNKALEHHYRHKFGTHHPQHFQDGIHEMNRVQIAECVCDWKARSEEFGTSFIYWIEHTATKRFNFCKSDSVYDTIHELTDHILEKAFV
jgi:hypothetical protein